jgi:uncharacterized protein (DUF58 family)
VKARVNRRPVPEGIRMTTVGLWYGLFAVVVGLAAANTGNNALYMVLSAMLAALVVSGIASRGNVRGLEIRLQPPGEVFANRPFTVRFEVASRAWLLPRWFLLLALTRSARPVLIPYLPRRAKTSGQFEVLVARRGRHRFAQAHLSTLFPFGFLRKGLRYPVSLEVLVFPEIFAAASVRPQESEPAGERSSRRAGSGPDLHSLRSFRPGDDARRIHWKQTARTGGLIFTVREAERSRRLSILFDNGVGELADAAVEARFERLVSEAATAAVDYLGRGYEVELVTRDESLPFAAGRRQRLAVLETLALIEPRPPSAAPLLSSDPASPELRVHLDVELEAAAV